MTATWVKDNEYSCDDERVKNINTFGTAQKITTKEGFAIIFEGYIVMSFKDGTEWESRHVKYEDEFPISFLFSEAEQVLNF